MIHSVIIECHIYESHSLKEKRSVIKKVVTRLRQQFNIATAELDYQDLWQRSQIGLVTISSDKIKAEQELQKAIAFVTRIPELEVTGTIVDWH
ncbi:DUF503 domain-containing protein [Fictibacillus iocasae]